MERARVPHTYTIPHLHQCAEPSLVQSVSVVVALELFIFTLVEDPKVCFLGAIFENKRDVRKRKPTSSG